MASMIDHTGMAYTIVLCIYLDYGIHLSINLAISGSPPASSDQYILADVHASRADRYVPRLFLDPGKE